MAISTKSRVYIVDDDDAVRDSLSFQLDIAGYDVTAFASGLDFLEAAAKLPPGCLILDVRMPEIDGLEVQSRLAERKLAFPTVITGHGDVPVAVRAMKAGAVDFVEKPFSEDAILDSIGLALGRVDEPAPPGRHPDSEAAANRLKLLSNREREVLQGLVAGFPNKTIAYDLGLSPRTVEVHRARVMDKMQARSLSELVRLALAAGVEI
jgi:two-component system, LuxR family, response regulator FixJ